MTTKNTKARGAGRLDERQTRRTSPEVRGDRGTSEDVQRTVETGLASVDDLENLLRNEFEQTALPNPPQLRGFHLCWMTTNSAYDTVQKRMQLGYQPVRRDELPHFDPTNGQKLTSYEGFVTCNEMLLMKIAEERYQTIMRYFHHKKPLEEEEAALAKAKPPAELENSKGRVEVEKGVDEWQEEADQAKKRAVAVFE